MLVATRRSNAWRLYRLDAPGAEPTAVTPDEPGIAVTTPADATAAFEPLRGEVFVYRRDVAAGRERHQIFRQAFDGGAPVLLTDGASFHGVPVWSRDGRFIAYESTARNGRDRDIWVAEPQRPGSARLLAALEGVWSVLDWAPDHRRLLALERRSATDARLWVVDAATAERRPIAPANGPAAIAAARFAPDGRVYVVTDEAAEYRRLARIDPASGRVEILTPALAADVEDFDLSPDGRLLAYVANEEGVGRLRLLDTSTRAERPLPGLPGGSVLEVRWHPRGGKLAFDVESSRHPRDVYSLDVATGRVSRWTRSETGGIDTSALAEAELVRWKSADGLVVSGFLYRPPARFTGRRPVLVNIHGGPEEQARPRFLGRSNYFLDELGVAIVYPNVRGSRGFGRTFLRLDDGFGRQGAIEDIGTLLDWIAARPDLDPSRVMLTGPSYGAFLSLAAAAAYPDRVRCVFAGFGMSNLVTFLERTDPMRRDYRRAEYGDERDPAMRAFLERISPLGRADRLRMPIFLAHAENDVVVPVQESEQMATALERSGRPPWFLVARAEGHGFGARANEEFMMAAWAYFMRKHLLD